MRKEFFESTLSEVSKKVCGDAYGLASLACWAHLGYMLKGLDAWMYCTMEDGARGRSAIQLIFEEDSKTTNWRDAMRILSLSFKDKRAFLPLQAADILAYELYKQGLRQFGQAKRPVRYPLRQLGRMPRQWHYVSEAHMQEHDNSIIQQLAELYRT